MPGAARVGDTHVCTNPSPSQHMGGPISPPGSPMVITNGMAQARAGDPLACAVPAPNFIVTGAATVLVDKRPAARVSDRTMHPPAGLIRAGSPDVLIGGPVVGVALGNPEAGLEMCKGAAQGRTSKRGNQSYSNCGVEAARQIIKQATGIGHHEDEVLDWAMENGHADEQEERFKSGGTTPRQRKSILSQHGVASTLEPNTMEAITQAVAERKGVISSHDVAVLWGRKDSGGHAVAVTGLRYDENGKLTGVVINDTGLGTCAQTIPAGQFKNSLRPWRDANVTTYPIW